MNHRTGLGTVHSNTPCPLRGLDNLGSKHKREMKERKAMALTESVNTMCVQMAPDSIHAYLSKKFPKAEIHHNFPISAYLR